MRVQQEIKEVMRLPHRRQPDTFHGDGIHGTGPLQASMGFPLQKDQWAWLRLLFRVELVKPFRNGECLRVALIPQGSDHQRNLLTLYVPFRVKTPKALCFVVSKRPARLADGHHAPRLGGVERPPTFDGEFEHHEPSLVEINEPSAT